MKHSELLIRKFLFDYADAHEHEYGRGEWKELDADGTIPDWIPSSGDEYKHPLIREALEFLNITWSEFVKWQEVQLDLQKEAK